MKRVASSKKMHRQQPQLKLIKKGASKRHWKNTYNLEAKEENVPVLARLKRKKKNNPAYKNDRNRDYRLYTPHPSHLSNGWLQKGQ